MFWRNNAIDKKDLLIPASILLGAVLISTSVIYSGRGFSLKTGIAGTGQQAAEGSEKINLSKRSGAYSIGKGKVEMVEFSDFQCPFCQRFYSETYTQIKEKYIDTGKLKLTFRHFPLSFHANAQKAAEGAECAGRQGKFWEFHDILFQKGKSDGTGLATTDLKQYAKNLGLDSAKFDQCLDNGETADIVKKDMEDGQEAKVSGTPTFIINGNKIVGAQSFAIFQSEIEKALK